MNMKNLEVKISEEIHGKGLFSMKNFKKGERIQYITGKVVTKISESKEDTFSMSTWYGLTKSKWIDPEDGIFAFLNHCCEPNAAIVGTKTLIALKDIKKGEEVSIDYSMTDADELWEMDCLCGVKTCRKVIRSIHNLPHHVFENHMPHIPKYFQREYLRNLNKNGVQLKSTNKDKNG